MSAIELGLAVTIIALAGISVNTSAISLLAQPASATTDVRTNTTAGQEGEDETASTKTNATINNASNALLGRLFSYGAGEDMQTNVNPINETYILVSYSGNRIILPPNSTGIGINSTERGNVTINIQPNGLSFNQGQAVITTEGDTATEEQQENANITFVLLSRTNPDGSGSGTSVTYFSTNSTGQLAFLDRMVAIGQVEYSPSQGINRFAEWEWKGGKLPFETGVNSTATTTINNASNALLGPPFTTVEFQIASVNAINETYIEIATVNDLTITPPSTTNATTTINGTETTNTTIDILPNGLDIDKGHSVIVTKGERGAAEQENATTTFMDISHTNPDDTGTGTGVVFFSTNSTGQLAFLDSMVGINDSKFSERSGAIRIWEWKGGTLPFESILPR
ncbi:MAG: hypothetical protein M3270_00165 [Thermoproteota archaeon]|nr:hypothetical protein [Thermoproteota archaeon]